MKTYKTIQPINVVGSDPLNELKIRVEYTKGGYNTKRGVYAWITPVARSQHFERYIMLGDVRECGFKVCLKETARKNDKVEQAICAVVEPLCDRIVELWEGAAYHEISRLLISAVANM